MADSSNHGKAQPPKDSSSDQSSSNNGSSSPPPPPPPVVAPPHMMYYPPPGPAGYPPGPLPPPQQYPPYPPPPQGYAPYPNEYPNPQYAGYNNYPGAPYYGTPQPYHHHPNNGGRGFIRSFIMCSCIIFTGFFIATLVVALVLHPQLPKYKVNTLSVTNFNSSQALTGDWTIGVTVLNPNDRLKSIFSDFKLDVVHGDDVIALSIVPDFEMEKHEEKPINVKASSSNNGVSFQTSDLDKITKERETGSMVFGVRIYSLTAFKSDSVSTRSSTVLAICEGIKVVFPNSTAGTGTMDNGGNPFNCQAYA